MTEMQERLLAAAEYWKGRTRPEGGTDAGEVAVERLYGDNWFIHISSLDGAKLLERLAEQWADEVVSIEHNPEFGTNVVVRKQAYCLHSGIRRKHEMSEANRLAAGVRLARARASRGEGGEDDDGEE